MPQLVPQHVTPRAEAAPDLMRSGDVTMLRGLRGLWASPTEFQIPHRCTSTRFSKRFRLSNSWKKELDSNVECGRLECGTWSCHKGVTKAQLDISQQWVLHLSQHWAHFGVEICHGLIENLDPTGLCPFLSKSLSIYIYYITYKTFTVHSTNVIQKKHGELRRWRVLISQNVHRIDIEIDHIKDFIVKYRYY